MLHRKYNSDIAITSAAFHITCLVQTLVYFSNYPLFSALSSRKFDATWSFAALLSNCVKTVHRTLLSKCRATRQCKPQHKQRGSLAQIACPTPPQVRQHGSSCGKLSQIPIHPTRNHQISGKAVGIWVLATESADTPLTVPGTVGNPFQGFVGSEPDHGLWKEIDGIPQQDFASPNILQGFQHWCVCVCFFQEASDSKFE